MTHMRQIRFKARAKRTKEWAEGYYTIILAPRIGREGEVIVFDEFPVIQVNDKQTHRCGSYLVDVYPQTLCQQTDMEDAAGLPIWEHDTVRATSIDHPDTYFDGEVVWMQTCFAVEDETGHHTPLCQLRAQYNITVTGNKFDGV
jgi:hypothetical protein